MNSKEKLEEIIKLGPVIPVVEIADSADALPVGRALLDGGIKTIEVTLRTDAALDVIATLANELPGLRVAAGTLLDTEMLDRAIDAGASFGVSPGSTRPLLRQAIATDFPFLPGAATPSEMMNLREMGFKTQKFFPAEASGGIPMLKSLAGPLRDVRFCPTGGISENSYRDFLSLPNVCVVGGSWIASVKLIAEKNWAAIRSNARAVSTR